MFPIGANRAIRLNLTAVVAVVFSAFTACAGTGCEVTPEATGSKLVEADAYNADASTNNERLVGHEFDTTSRAIALHLERIDYGGRVVISRTEDGLSVSGIRLIDLIASAYGVRRSKIVELDRVDPTAYYNVDVRFNGVPKSALSDLLQTALFAIEGVQGRIEEQERLVIEVRSSMKSVVPESDGTPSFRGGHRGATGIAIPVGNLLGYIEEASGLPAVDETSVDHPIDFAIALPDEFWSRPQADQAAIICEAVNTQTPFEARLVTREIRILHLTQKDGAE